MTSVADNRLHADPGIEAHELHPQRSAILETAQQRDRAKTIYEKSKPGRRAFVAPELDVPKHELPERFRRSEPAKLPDSPWSGSSMNRLRPLWLTDSTG